ncbi:MAG: hypothetical protein KJO26_03715 [Deltaproteobacteria bacterium]|nr:hypothetical protein [Deltaproteobacteria bacterium]
MKKLPNTIFIFPVFFFLSLLTFLSISQATEFDTMVVPSLMDSDMDGWYKIPPNSGPIIHRAYSVYQGQMFNLLIFFKGYSADNDKNLHVRYDVQVYDPQGNTTEDKGSDLLAYQGPLGSPEALMLNQQYLKIVFTEKYHLGTYKIKVTAYDKNSGKTFTSETPIELIPFTLPEKFKSQQEAESWMMEYYQKPTQVKAISALQTFVELDPKWIKENLNILIFFKRVFSDNPFLFRNIAKHFNTFSKENQKKLLLISAISGDSVIEPFTTGDGNEELKKFYNSAKEIIFPDISGGINSAVQLDILWSEFLTTGKYEPIRKIVSALALKKYKGYLDKIKAGEIELTKEVERNAYLEATYKSAVWSLISNCKQMPLVFKYCVFMYENEPLDEDLKSQLGSILRIAQKRGNDSKNQ